MITTGNVPETTRVTEKITTVVTTELVKTEKISEEIKTTQLITNEKTEKVIDCPEMCLECNSEKNCKKCNKYKNYYPIELDSSSPDSSPSETVQCITEETKKIDYPNYYLDKETESFKLESFLVFKLTLSSLTL